jgi:hypothetical protein
LAVVSAWMLATGIDHSKAPIPNKTFAVHSRPLHKDEMKEKTRGIHQNPGSLEEK